MLPLRERIEVVRLMIKYESTTMVRRDLQRQNWKNIPSDPTMRSLLKKFLETGSVADRDRCGRPITSVSDENCEAAAAYLADNPDDFHSVNELKNILDISFGSTHSILRQHLGMKPYKLQLHQRLSDEDKAARVSACQTMLEKNEENGFFENLITSDEAVFHLNGMVNRHNCRIWSTEKPKPCLIKEQSSPKVVVWIGMSATRLYGPYFFEQSTVKSDNYLTMLQTFFLPELQREGILNQAWFQQDGAPPHWATSVRRLLNEVFEDRWIGRSGPLPWPARSPDLAPPDFFFWGYLKNSVYRSRRNNLNELKAAIMQESLNIGSDVLQRVSSCFKDRLMRCVAYEGDTVEK